MILVVPAYNHFHDIKAKNILVAVSLLHHNPA